MRFVIVALAFTPVAMFPKAAQAGTTYEATSFGNTLFGTSSHFDNYDEVDGATLGYFCLINNRLSTEQPTFSIARYRVSLDGESGYYNLIPLNAFELTPDGSGNYNKRGITPPSEHWIRQMAAEMNLFTAMDGGGWFENNMQPNALGISCVDSGISGTFQFLERRGININ